jgi:hypothetical protein
LISINFIIFLKLICNPHIFIDIPSFVIEPEFRYLKAHVALSWSNLSFTGLVPTEALFFEAVRDTICSWEIMEKVLVKTLPSHYIWNRKMYIRRGKPRDKCRI